jgi:hypothetical protein
MTQYLVDISIAIDPDSDRPRRRSISIEGTAADVGQEFGKLAMEFGKIVLADAPVVSGKLNYPPGVRGVTVFDTTDQQEPGARA